MIGEWSTHLIMFGLVFGLNVIPAFAPPTWMALAFVGFQFPGTSPVLLAGRRNRGDTGQAFPGKALPFAVAGKAVERGAPGEHRCHQRSA